MRRSEAIEFFESLGAIVQSSVTKTTDILIVGDERGEVKYNRALKLGVTILPWPMVKALGLVEKRPGSTLELETIRLTQDVILQMIRLVDNLYAHCITGGGGQLRGFMLGSESIESLLRAAWGASVNGDSGGCEDHDEDSRELVGRYLRECLSYWKGLVDELENQGNYS